MSSKTPPPLSPAQKAIAKTYAAEAEAMITRFDRAGTDLTPAELASGLERMITVVRAAEALGVKYVKQLEDAGE